MSPSLFTLPNSLTSQYPCTKMIWNCPKMTLSTKSLSWVTNEVCKVPAIDKLSKWFLSISFIPSPIALANPATFHLHLCFKSPVSCTCFCAMFCPLWQCKNYCILLLWAWSVVPSQRPTADMVGPHQYPLSVHFTDVWEHSSLALHREQACRLSQKCPRWPERSSWFIYRWGNDRKIL